ncbi:hypothetical protein AB0M02_29220 [Actinoplanes sp. NPDC051861]|uniref:hypothetical protein n=1 Tax=Actinoplanes sp. NPDC051861 TaxID=3155170 RepID=UPI00342375D0
MVVPAVLLAPDVAPKAAGRLTTPQLYRLVAAALIALGLAAGAAQLAAVRERQALMHDVTAVSGPLSGRAQELYRALSDADATAATAFLSPGVEPAELRKRYLDDIARATAALTVALREADDEDAVRLRTLADRLPVYTGLVETARSYNRLGLPLGGAYLMEASTLMRQTLLPEAQGLLAAAQRRVIDAQRDATGTPITVYLSGLAGLAALVAAQVLLARRTNRLFNRGLIAAFLVAVVALGWTTVALNAAGKQARAGQTEGSSQVLHLAAARRSALQARADEGLTLIARGNGARFEEDYARVFDELTGTLGRVSIAGTDIPLRRWTQLHGEMREHDDTGDYRAAVAMATDPEPAGLSQTFRELDMTLDAALTAANDRVRERARRAAGALTGLTALVLLLTAGQLAAVVLGFRPRIGEYR